MGLELHRKCGRNLATHMPVYLLCLSPEVLWQSHVTSYKESRHLFTVLVCCFVGRFFEEREIPIKKVEYSWGATEVKAMLPGVGAICDITETGSSLRANKLRVSRGLGWGYVLGGLGPWGLKRCALGV
jgi:hypothetical protein